MLCGINKNHQTLHGLWSIKLHFGLSSCILNKIWWNKYSILLLGKQSSLTMAWTLIYRVALCFSVNKIWWNKSWILLLNLWHELWSIKLHFASRWKKSDKMNVAFFFSERLIPRIEGMDFGRESWNLILSEKLSNN